LFWREGITGDASIGFDEETDPWTVYELWPTFELVPVFGICPTFELCSELVGCTVFGTDSGPDSALEGCGALEIGDGAKTVEEGEVDGIPCD
jgi:hypothetical protein